MLGVSPALALTVTSNADSGAGSLRAAIAAAVSGDTIDFDCVSLNCPATITLTSQGNNQGFPGPTAFSISGKTLTITATNPGDITLMAQPGTTSATSLRLFFVDSDATLFLQNLILNGGAAIGGHGGKAYKGGGGGAAGLGGAIFSQGNLTLNGVSLEGNSAKGGSGFGNATFGKNYAGGGGLGGDGGDAPSGGGGGTGGDGGLLYTIALGGKTYAGPGGPGLGGAGGGKSGGYSSVSHSGYFPAAASSGGGSGGGYQFNAYAGSDGGGGGSSGASGFLAGHGGNGGFGGGGGGNYGGPIVGCVPGGGGSGGFGGGGGASQCGPGLGGIGGSQGGGYSNQGTPGGGGAGFGGAVFARSGTLTVQSPASGGLAGNIVTAGGGAGNGAAVGSGLFLVSGITTTFDIDADYTVTNSIADDSAASLPSGNSYTAGNGAGASITKAGNGTLLLDSINTFAGSTTVSAGVLGGTGSVAGPVVLSGNGAISPGDGAIAIGAGMLHTGPLDWAAGGSMSYQLAASPAHSDKIVVNGALTKNGSGTFLFHFGMGNSAPAVGTVYTLIQSTDANAFAAGDFSFDVDLTSFDALSGHFGNDGSNVTFTVDTVSADRVFVDGFDG